RCCLVQSVEGPTHSVVNKDFGVRIVCIGTPVKSEATGDGRIAGKNVHECQRIQGVTGNGTETDIELTKHHLVVVHVVPCRTNLEYNVEFVLAAGNGI